MPRSAPVASCPCGQGGRYETCCARWHGGDAAPDAETLMRSRYSAYALGKLDYLLVTWHPDTRPAELALDANTRWLGLEIKRHASTGPDRALVEFVARYRIGGDRAVRLHEISRFLREDGRWFYVDGEFPGRV